MALYGKNDQTPKFQIKSVAMLINLCLVEINVSFECFFISLNLSFGMKAMFEAFEPKKDPKILLIDLILSSQFSS